MVPRSPSSSHHRDETLSNGLYTRRNATNGAVSYSLYTPEEKRRRDATPWTLVQGILAPIQLLACFVSVALILRYLHTGEGLALATGSIVVKTMLLYAIMVTGAIWEREVFGQYLFARAFFWEDVVSMLVLALHTAYLATLLFDIGSPREQMLLALAAYVTYAINATQFLLKLRAARLQSSRDHALGRLATEAAE